MCHPGATCTLFPEPGAGGGPGPSSAACCVGGGLAAIATVRACWAHRGEGLPDDGCIRPGISRCCQTPIPARFGCNPSTMPCRVTWYGRNFREPLREGGRPCLLHARVRWQEALGVNSQPAAHRCLLQRFESALDVQRLGNRGQLCESRRDNAPLDTRAIPKAPHHPVAKSFAVKTCIKKDRY